MMSKFVEKTKSVSKILIVIFVSLVYVICKIPFKALFKKKNKKTICIWVLGDISCRSLVYFFTLGVAVKFVALWKVLLDEGYGVKLQWGRKIGSSHNQIIFFDYSRYNFNFYKVDDYVAEGLFITEQLVVQNNQVIPSIAERKYWENKGYMHERFAELGIRHPRTFLYNNVEELIACVPLGYPFIVKEEHSAGSIGVHLVANKRELKNLLQLPAFQNKRHKVIVQQLLNMRRDLRVILVGGLIVAYYWRINSSAEWKPTSTKHGSYVKYADFPETWRDDIINTFKKLHISTGAFDVAWENDDLETEPLYLEVSPSYETKPYIDLEKWGMEYSSFVTNHWFRYLLLFIQERYRVHRCVAKQWIQDYLNNTEK